MKYMDLLKNPEEFQNIFNVNEMQYELEWGLESLDMVSTSIKFSSSTQVHILANYAYLILNKCSHLFHLALRVYVVMWHREEVEFLSQLPEWRVVQ